MVPGSASPCQVLSLAENFLFSAKGVPKGPRLIFSRQRKNFFTAGGLRGSRGFGGEKNLEREDQERKKSTKRSPDEKIVQNGRTVRSARGLGGVCFKCKIIFLQKTHQIRQIWILRPLRRFYTFNQNIYILY